MTECYSRRRAASMAGLLVLACGLPGTGEAFAQSLFKTDRVVGLTGAACSKDDECTTFESEVRSVDAGQSVKVAFECPAGYPYLKGWDATYNEHVELSALPPRNSQDTALSLIAYNHADVPGYFKVVLGCGTLAKVVTSMPEWVGSLPTNVPAFVAALREDGQ